MPCVTGRSVKHVKGAKLNSGNCDVYISMIPIAAPWNRPETDLFSIVLEGQTVHGVPD